MAISSEYRSNHMADNEQERRALEAKARRDFAPQDVPSYELPDRCNDGRARLGYEAMIAANAAVRAGLRARRDKV